MRNPIIFMFSGQGSHYYHMGKELYQHNPAFQKWMRQLNDLMFKQSGRSVIDEIYNERKSKGSLWDSIEETHPAIFMVEYALAQVMIENGIEPDFILGASLGEYTAVALAGVITLEETLECILKQAELVQRKCQIGRMTAIISNPDLYVQSPFISSNSELAGINFPNHFVISGEYEKLLRIENDLKNKEILFQALPVRYGFHSANIEPMESDYKMFLEKFNFGRPQISLISSYLCGQVPKITGEHFWNVIRRPVLFQKTILELEKDSAFHYLDLGPSGTLATFVKNNLSKDSGSKVYDILTPFGQDISKINKVLEVLR